MSCHFWLSLSVFEMVLFLGRADYWSRRVSPHTPILGNSWVTSINHIKRWHILNRNKFCVMTKQNSISWQNKIPEQRRLLQLNKGNLPSRLYEVVKPTGFLRPRMYGLSKNIKTSHYGQSYPWPVLSSTNWLNGYPLFSSQCSPCISVTAFKTPSLRREKALFWIPSSVFFCSMAKKLKNTKFKQMWQTTRTTNLGSFLNRYMVGNFVHIVKFENKKFDPP